MSGLKIAVISCLGEKTYAEKYQSLSEIHKPYWKNHFLMHRDNPIDVADYYYLSRNKYSCVGNTDRHVYVNGIIIGNYLKSKGFNIELYNSAADIENNITMFDCFLFSTSFEGGNYPSILEKEINRIRNINPQSLIFVGGLGLYNAYLNYKSGKKGLYEALIRLNADYYIVSDCGLEMLENKLRSTKRNTNEPEILIDESPKKIAYDYSVHNFDVSFQSAHSVLACSSGCAYNCLFCSYRFIHKKHSELPLELVKKNLDQITSATRLNPLKFLRISDECLNDNESRFFQIVDLIKRKNIRWCCFLRGDLLSDKSIVALSESDCDFVSLGLESASALIQKKMNKNINLRLFEKNLHKFKKNGIAVVVSIIVGYYGETEETITQTVNYLLNINPDILKVNVWTPLPDEHNTPIGKENNFATQGGIWKHHSMSLNEAYHLATNYFHKNKHFTVLPPEISIFDQWPQLAADGLAKSEILDLFREYHLKSLNTPRATMAGF